MSSAVVSLGTYIEMRQVAGGGAWTEIAEVRTVGGPNPEMQIHDVTHLRSPDFWREFLGGLRDGGEVSLGVNFISTTASQQLVITAFNQTPPVKSDFKITLSSGQTIPAFEGFIKNYSLNHDRESPAEATITIKVTGPLANPA